MRGYGLLGLLQEDILTDVGAQALFATRHLLRGIVRHRGLSAALFGDSLCAHGEVGKCHFKPSAVSESRKIVQVPRKSFGDGRK